MGKQIEVTPKIEGESKKLSGSTNTETQTKTENGSEVKPNTEETIEKTDEAQAKTETKVETEAKGYDVKHIVKYVGNGVWIDSNHQTWMRSSDNQNIISQLQLTDAEYQTREDIKFMVSYGEMTHTVVE